MRLKGDQWDSYVGRIKSGHSKISFTKRTEICELLGVSFFT